MRCERDPDRLKRRVSRNEASQRQGKAADLPNAPFNSKRCDVRRFERWTLLVARSFPMSAPLIAPSLLAADFAKLADEVRAIAAAGADWLHLDIMDGHFVDNISFGPAIVATVRKLTKLPLDVHLMIERPDHYAPRFVEAGANSITVHVEPEAQHDVGKTLRALRAAGCRAGLSLNPATPFTAVEPHLAEIDLLLIMTVHPGFGGQAFRPEMMEKVRAARAWKESNKSALDIEVDGGINADTAKLCVENGANVLVAGTSIFKTDDYTAHAMRSSPQRLAHRLGASRIPLPRHRRGRALQRRLGHDLVVLRHAHHFLDRGLPLPDPPPAILPQRLHALRDGALLQLAAVSLLHNHAPHRLVDDANFVNRQPALITGLPAIITADTAHESASQIRASGNQSPPNTPVGYSTICAQSGQIVRTNRCARNARTVDASRNCSTPMSSKRVIPPTASFVCSVLKTSDPSWPRGSRFPPSRNRESHPP